MGQRAVVVGLAFTRDAGVLVASTVALVAGSHCRIQLVAVFADTLAIGELGAEVAVPVVAGSSQARQVQQARLDVHQGARASRSRAARRRRARAGTMAPPPAGLGSDRRAPAVCADVSAESGDPGGSAERSGSARRRCACGSAVACRADPTAHPALTSHRAGRSAASPPGSPLCPPLPPARAIDWCTHCPPSHRKSVPRSPRSRSLLQPTTQLVSSRGPAQVFAKAQLAPSRSSTHRRRRRAPCRPRTHTTGPRRTPSRARTVRASGCCCPFRRFRCRSRHTPARSRHPRTTPTPEHAEHPTEPRSLRPHVIPRRFRPTVPSRR